MTKYYMLQHSYCIFYVVKEYIYVRSDKLHIAILQVLKTWKEIALPHICRGVLLKAFWFSSPLFCLPFLFSVQVLDPIPGFEVRNQWSIKSTRFILNSAVLRQLSDFFNPKLSWFIWYSAVFLYPQC